MGLASATRWSSGGRRSLRRSGPATDPDGWWTALVAAGMDCARLNCSHGTADELRRRAGEVRAAAKRAGRSVGLLFDLQGPKLRLSADTPTRMLGRARRSSFSPASRRPWPRSGTCGFPGLSAARYRASEIVIGDGVPRLAVDSVGPGEVVARAVSVGELAPRKGINVTYARPELPAITDRTRLIWRLPPSLEQTSSRCRSSARRPISRSFRRGWPRITGMAG